MAWGSYNFYYLGGIHGIIIVLEKALNKTYLKVNRNNSILYLLSTLFTFAIVCFAWIFFRANSLADSVYIVQNLFDFVHNYHNYYCLGLPKPEFILAIISIILLLLFDTFHKKYNAIQILNKTNFVIRCIVYTIIIYSIVIFGVYGNDSVSEFIYFQF